MRKFDTPHLFTIYLVFYEEFYHKVFSKRETAEHYIDVICSLYNMDKNFFQIVEEEILIL